VSRALPPGIGTKMDEVLKRNPHQIDFLNAHAARVCGKCKQLVPARGDGSIHCPMCTNVEANPLRAFNRFGLFAGRRGGKTKIGAVAGLKEIQIPNSNGIVAAPNYPKLFELDSTFDTFISRVPPEWVKDWDSELYTLTLINGARVGFRSADDPQRMRGPGVHWMWLDEGREISAEAWEAAEPSLTEYDGICILTTSSGGEDWCYEQFWDTARRLKEPGYYADTWHTTANPIVKKEVVERRRRTTNAKTFRREYESSFEAFEGAIYEDLTRERHFLADDDAIRRKIPEWPLIDPSRHLLVGLDSGADHPFGGVIAVPTEHGIICIREYLKRDAAAIVHKTNLRRLVGNAYQVLWAGNKNERQLTIEFSQRPDPISIVPAENDQWVGIQRTQTWIYSGKFFIAYTCPQLWTQMKSYHMAANTLKSGEKRAIEKVYKKKDELPDAVRYMLMAWPILPESAVDPTERPLSDLPEASRHDVERLRRILKAQMLAEEGLTPIDDGYPLGDFYQ